MIHRKQVLELVRATRANGITRAQLARQLAPTFGHAVVQRALPELLDELESRGEVLRATGGRTTAIEFTDYWAGELRVTSRGFGVVRVGERDLPDIVVPPEGLATALDGDRVLVHRPLRRRRGQLLPEKFGEVVRILKRRHPTLVGRFVADRRRAWVDPFSRRIKAKVVLEPAPETPPRDGEFVEVAIGEARETGTIPGRLLRCLGLAGEPGVDEEVVLAELAIPVAFPPAALREADALPSGVSADDAAGRVDRRDQAVVTIDGESARDFDDAIFASAGGDGNLEVYVHIADVSHYVRPGGALDSAARERGTSVYLPGRCVPMLPERLSNQLCSLLPGEDRLAFTVRFLVRPNGAVEGYRAERTVFRSRRRCTYAEVVSWLETGAWPANVPAGVRLSLELLDEAARRIGRRRQARGAIDFDLPEPEILLDPQGFMTGVQAAPRNRAHRLIEELMIAANECVARMLVWGRQLALFRVHERPSAAKLAELQTVLAEFGLQLKGDLEDLSPRALQRVLTQVAETPGERFLQTLILRALARATYLPECKGHYALATEFYLHFTSPIRRYPDLMVHRFLGELLAGKVPTGPARELAQAELEELAPHCSLTERRAEEAEREVVQWKQAQYMRARIGEEFVGHVTGVVAFGLFVQLTEVFVEGLVHVAELRDDFYRYDEAGHRLVGQRHGNVFRLGDELRVRVKGIDEEYMEINLEPVVAQVPPSRPRRPPSSQAPTAPARRVRRRERSQQ